MNHYKNLFSLAGKVVAVCGASGLIGKEVSKCLHDLDAKVIHLDIQKPQGHIKNFFEFDVTSETSIAQVLDDLISNYGRIDGFINCSYPRTPDWAKTLEESSSGWFNTNLELHLGGYFSVSKAVLERMREAKGGSLVNFSSIYGFLGPNFNLYKDLEMKNPVAYSAIKGGIINLTKYLASYYGSHQIRVNTISPGGVEDGQNPEFIKRYCDFTPLRRMASKEEVAAASVFLVSDASTYITGHNLIVDGGWSAI